MTSRRSTRRRSSAVARLAPSSFPALSVRPVFRDRQERQVPQESKEQRVLATRARKVSKDRLEPRDLQVRWDRRDSLVLRALRVRWAQLVPRERRALWAVRLVQLVRLVLRVRPVLEALRDPTEGPPDHKE